MDVVCGIYKIENLINHKVYIGQSVNIYGRWKSHKRTLNNGVSKNTLLQRAWNKYKEYNFAFEIIEACNEEELDSKEIYYIDLYDSHNNGYNIESGGNKNKHLSEETKRALSEIHKGKKLSQEVRDKMSKSRIGDKNPMYGKKHTQTTKDKISKNNKGKTGHPMSERHKSKLKEINTGKILSDETKQKISVAHIGKIPYNKDLNPIYCVELGRIFDNATVAAKELGLRSDSIIACCKHYPSRKTCGGFHWEYAIEVITNQCEINEVTL